MKNARLTLLLLVVAGCTNRKNVVDSNGATYIPARPALHFTPEKNWINDPNGLVYLDGEYHLFYQYNPYGKEWGHMSWGHAVSKDLVHWNHLPVALEEYANPSTGDSTMIFSGTVVVDEKNSADFGNNAMIAIYTSHVHKDNQTIVQHQSLAFSIDKGRTWKRYTKNPIVNINCKDFRDPKVFWYEPQQKWVMVVVIPDKFTVQFYESKNLTQWNKCGEFGHAGDTTRIWECPDLFPLRVDNEPGKEKWVLSLSGSHPQGAKFVGMQYLVGEFDGKKFSADDLNPLYVNYGKDFYAGIVYNHLLADEQRTVMIGWASNWTYANQIPDAKWRGAMALPRELSLHKTNGGYRLIQKPVHELINARSKELMNLKDIDTNTFELEIELAGGGVAGVLIGSDTSVVKIGYDFNSKMIFLDRTHAGITNFNLDFASRDFARMESNGTVKLRIFYDAYLTEVFSGDGSVSLTDLTFLKNKLDVRTFGETTQIKVSIFTFSKSMPID